MCKENTVVWMRHLNGSVWHASQTSIVPMLFREKCCLTVAEPWMPLCAICTTRCRFQILSCYQLSLISGTAQQSVREKGSSVLQKALWKAVTKMLVAIRTFSRFIYFCLFHEKLLEHFNIVKSKY